jgi:hypothetical protein
MTNHPKDPDNMQDINSGGESDSDPAVRLLREGLAGLNHSFPVDTPDAEWFERRIEGARKELKRRLIRDLVLFLLLAAGLLTVMAMAILHLPAIFIALQAAGLLAVPFVIARGSRKRVQR